jgi:hypothetical protein
LNKKLIAVIALILTLVSTNVVLAVLYMSRDVTVTGGVAASGTIAIYKDVGQTELTSLDIPEFQGTTQSSNTYFWVGNTGNMPVAVYWDISIANPNS